MTTKSMFDALVATKRRHIDAVFDLELRYFQKRMDIELRLIRRENALLLGTYGLCIGLSILYMAVFHW